MRQTTSPSSGRIYGLVRICATWDIPRSSVYAVKARRAGRVPLPAKRGTEDPLERH